jgi:hypothetical protein
MAGILASVAGGLPIKATGTFGAIKAVAELQTAELKEKISPDPVFVKKVIVPTL